MTGNVGGFRTLAQLGAPLRPYAPALDPVTDPDTTPPTTPPTLPPWLQPAPHDGLDRGPGGDAQPRVQPQREPDPVDQPAAPGAWNVPLINVELPTPTSVVETGTELIRNWHPRDPSVRIRGSYDDSRPEPTDEGREATGAEGDSSAAGSDSAQREDEDKDKRTKAAEIAMLVGLGGGFLQNGIDVLRLVKKYPEAMRAGQFDPALGRLGRLPTALGLTVLTKPDNRILDPALLAETLDDKAATLQKYGMTFDKVDNLGMKASVLLGASLAAIQIGSSIPNLKDALDNEGPWHENLMQSKSGRAGILQLGGGLLGAAVFATALKQTASTAGAGVVGKVIAAGSAPIMAQPRWGRIGLATGMLVAANELGFLDMLNKDEARSTGQVLGDAVHKTPILNDSKMRTAALLGAGGIVGFKAHRAIAAAGTGIAGLSKGYWVAGAAVAGLLGAQLLGGLKGLDG